MENNQFLWGASTAAYQIEGAAKSDGRGLSIWDVFSHTPGKVKDGHTGDVACDHYNRYPEDCALMRELGLGAYRFSTSWSRIIPDGTGAVNAAGLDFYDRLVDELLAQGIAPWTCLFHWDLPQAIQERGGWANRDTALWFADYAAIVAGRLGDRVKSFSTFNEPAVFVFMGNLMGQHAPGIQDLSVAVSAAHVVNLAHGDAIVALRGAAPKADLGVICNQTIAVPQTESAEDRQAASTMDLFANRIFADPMLLGRYPDELVPFFAGQVRDGDMERIHQPLDFLGVNHYMPVYAKADPAAPMALGGGTVPEGRETTMMGWEVAPDIFRQTLLNEYKRYGLPIYVTENGMADMSGPAADGSVDDQSRIAFLDRYIAAMQQAIAEGADVRGYFCWSLLDNFEWAEGYTPRFGLIHVDYETQKRTPKASFNWYKSLIKNN